VTLLATTFQVDEYQIVIDEVLPGSVRVLFQVQPRRESYRMPEELVKGIRSRLTKGAIDFSTSPELSATLGTDQGRAVQVDPMKPLLKAPGSVLLKLISDGTISNFGFNFNWRHYIEGSKVRWWSTLTSTTPMASSAVCPSR